MARKIIGIKVCYYLIKIFLHNKIHSFTETLILLFTVDSKRMFTKSF